MGELCWPVVKIKKKFNCRLKNNGVTTLIFGVTWRHQSHDQLAVGNFFRWSVVTMCLSCTVMMPEKSDGRMHTRTDRRTLRWFYTLSNAVHHIGQTTRMISF